MRGELVYKYTLGTYASITKKQYHSQNVRPIVIQKYKRAAVKAEKSGDVRQLLNKHFGDQWQRSTDPNLRYYHDFFSRQQSEHNDGFDSDCEFVNETNEVIV